jgi:methyl-accepting chemotaxis protein/methyl-accepting chemotaxis protein-1 (serine sensor receptor)
LAEGTSQQAASLEETSASTEEINSMARRNSENSHSAADLVKASDQRFADTNRSLQDMVLAMGEINTSSDKISKIIKVIDEIAFQTNILALNAAVEAARAGEAGMGFAVVADEVRNLAQRCAQAARDTAVLIEESISKSNDGKLKVDQVAKAIHTITEQSTQIKTLVDEVHLGSQEQSRGIEQIGRAIVQMEQVTQKAAASAEESASAAEELKAQSNALKDVVSRLNTVVGIANSYRQTPVRPAPSRTASRSTTTNNLAALRTAVSHKPAAKPQPVPMPVSTDSFPMDEDFKEF